MQEERYRSMWERATDEILEKLVGVSPEGLTFVGQRRHVGKLIGETPPDTLSRMPAWTGRSVLSLCLQPGTSSLAPGFWIRGVEQ
jgi:hypothetical protein